MKQFSGDITLMPLPDLLQWVEINRKTGVLTIKNADVKKQFYFQDGKMTFVSSNREGERYAEFFSKAGQTDTGKMEAFLREASRLGVPFTGYLIAEGVVSKKGVEQSMIALIEKALTDAFEWKAGSFEFSNVAPSFTLNGPVMFETSFAVLKALKLLDEKFRTASDAVAANVFKQITGQISEGNIEIPPVPDVMLKLNEAIKSDTVSNRDIIKLIMSDQILTSKILRVVNSPFYSPLEEITSLQQAIIIMGLKSILSIVAVHSLSGFSPRHVDKVRNILRHSLFCAFISKKIAPLLKADPEEAFVCGLLHDIGKTLLVGLVSDKGIADDVKDRLIRDYHAEAGYLLASRWNLSEVVRYAVRYHHNPGASPAHKKAVEVAYYADILSKSKDLRGMEILGENIIGGDPEKVRRLYEDINSIKELVAGIM
ncbi:MAG TPA: HDOD domain-containing protein [Thermodesulfovibrionales bacterium]|nr:HDOD domain-containing protein [Thermodesulfovibrionales bacterium]